MFFFSLLDNIEIFFIFRGVKIYWGAKPKPKNQIKSKLKKSMKALTDTAWFCTKKPLPGPCR